LDNDGTGDACDAETLIVNDTVMPAGEYTFRNLRITNNAVLTLKSNTSQAGFKGVKINADNIIVETGARINANGQGWAASSGNGQGYMAQWSYSANGKTWAYRWGGGAGHGGKGGNSDVSTTGGKAYGSAAAPVELGSGGGLAAGFSAPAYAYGGAGGGAAWLNVADTTTVDGAITSNGAKGGYATDTKSGSGKVTYYYWAGGGGSGGSIYIITDTITGSGGISAAGGGVSNYKAGGGSGGRISINSNTDSFTGSVNVAGAAGGWQVGGSGTVYRA